MLKKIVISNFAIIDFLEVDFSSGFNIITGETGAGKSLIINAIDILFGSKIDNQMLRFKSKPLKISAIFKKGDKKIQISRLFDHGKSSSYINNKKVSKAEILNLSFYLVQFQKQHDSNKLLNSKKHIEILDNYAVDLTDLEDLQKLYLNYMQASKDYKNILSNESIYKDRFELYQYQLNELNSVDLDENKELSLNNEYKICVNSKKILEILNTYNKNNEYSDSSSSYMIEEMSKSLSNYNKIDNDIFKISSRLDDIVLELKDIDLDIYNLQKKYYYDSETLNILEHKVSEYESIKRKYGGSLKAAIDYKNKIKEELADMPSFDAKIKKIYKDLDEKKKKYEKKAEKISLKRKDAAIEMSKKINAYLVKMDMPNAQMKIEVNKSQNYTENGFDVCEIYAITNKGESFKPIKKIASGGEISRVMLAINLVTQKKQYSGTLIFDEVDTGISGSTASNVGSLLKKLSNDRQLIIITHLPQIASKSDHHIYITKINEKDRVSSVCKILDYNEHSNEIARMLSGEKITDYSIKQAKEMIAHG
tara:strand:+ start:3416 stop:5023 length:1608 start_codon:yes stop_codon:yes gene_type:complete